MTYVATKTTVSTDATEADAQWMKDHAPVREADVNVHADDHAAYMASAH